MDDVFAGKLLPGRPSLDGEDCQDWGVNLSIKPTESVTKEVSSRERLELWQTGEDLGLALSREFGLGYGELGELCELNQGWQA